MPKGPHAKSAETPKALTPARLRSASSMRCCAAARRWTMPPRPRAACRRPTPRWPAPSPAKRLRRLPDLDALIDGATRQRLPDDSKARMVLRLALAQKIGLGTPDHALVATALPLVDGGPRRLVHGVLGTLLRKGVPAIDAPRLPEAVEERWRAAWGEDVVMAARRAIAHRPPLDLSFASDRGLCAAFPTAFRSRPRHRRLDSMAAVTELAGLRRGRLVGPGSRRLASRAADPGRAKRVLDACAAPGGKTMQLAAAGHDVTALDRVRKSSGPTFRQSARTGLKARNRCCRRPRWTPTQPFDAVLLDAPCSATGTFRRHPEVLYRARPAIIEQSAELQAELLARAADWVRPGGSLVYAVCSLEPAGRRAADRSLPRRRARIIATRAGTAARRRRDATSDAAGSASCPACSRRKAASTASSPRTLSEAPNPG